MKYIYICIDMVSRTCEFHAVLKQSAVVSGLCGFPFALVLAVQLSPRAAACQSITYQDFLPPPSKSRCHEGIFYPHVFWEMRKCCCRYPHLYAPFVATNPSGFSGVSKDHLSRIVVGTKPLQNGHGSPRSLKIVSPCESLWITLMGIWQAGNSDGRVWALADHHGKNQATLSTNYMTLLSLDIQSYCWWMKSCTTWDV